MYLKQIKVFMNQHNYDKTYCSHFDYQVFFIGYFLSHKIKKLKFMTDNTFNSIDIIIGDSTPDIELIEKRLTIHSKFDTHQYNQANEENRCKYCIDLVKNALYQTSRIKSIPLKQLIGFCDDLIESKFVYRWRFKKIYVPNLNLTISFSCELNTQDFKLIATAFSANDSQPICNGQVIRTKPDDIFFSLISPNIQIKGNQILITSKWHTPLVSLNLLNLSKGSLVVEFPKTPYPNDIKATENFYQLQKELRYNNYEFK